MSCYFFDFQDDDQVTLDDEGTELESRQEARTAAIQSLPQAARDELPDGEDHRFQVTVREKNQPIYRTTLTFHGEWLV